MEKLKFQNERKNEAIRTLNIFLTETQHQYSECFAEAAKQDSLLELQRDSIESLQQKIICKEYIELFKIILLHYVYSANIFNLQDQLRIRISDCETLKSQVDRLVKTNRSLEEKYLTAKFLWEKTDSELKCCLESQKKSFSTKNIECNIGDQEMQSLQFEYNALIEKNASLKTELQKYIMDFKIVEQELKKQNEKCLCIPNLQSELERLGNEAHQLRSELEKENEDLKVELQKYKVEFEMIQVELIKQSTECIPKLKSELERLNSEKQELTTELEQRKNQIEDLMEKLQWFKENENRLEEKLVELEANQREKLNSSVVKDELYKCSCQIESLTAEAKGKQEELKMLQDLKGEFEKMEHLEKINELRDRELMKCRETVSHLYDDILVQNDKIKTLQEQANCYESIMTDQTKMIEELKENLLSNEQEIENYISELSNSKEMLCSLKVFLKEKSDCMAKLQADYQMLKNDNSILKMENGLFESKAKEDICELRSKMKEIQLKLCIAEDSYKMVTLDFNKSQELLLKTANREVELQQTLTNMEKSFYSKMMCVEKEEAKLKDLVNKMNEELEAAREELTSKKIELEQIQSACNLYSSQLENTQYDLQGLKENILKLEETNCCFRKKLQDCREENCALLKQKKLLEQNNCKCINELEDMYKSLVDLRKECKMKSRSLASMTAELTQATASRSELCNESQYVVSYIRKWMEEQKNVVESLHAKVKTKQQELMHLSFEKKALLAKVKEQKRIINALLQKRKRSLKSSVGQSTRNICTKCYSLSSGITQIRSGPITNYSRMSKRCPMKTSRKNPMNGDSWFFPKIEYLTKTLKKSNEILNKELASQSESDPGLDENRDCGYQSSTSK